MTTLSFSNLGHVQYVVHDLKTMLTYFREVMGMPLLSIDWADENNKVVRATLGFSDSSTLAFVWSPEVLGELLVGTAHSSDPAKTNTRGTMQHVAFNARTLDDLLALRDRIRAHGILCTGPINHGFCHSIYFAGPEGLSLEVATHNDVRMQNWIEPSTVESLGIDEQELHHLCNPTAYDPPSTPVANPPLEASTAYRLAWSDEEYAAIYQADSSCA